MSGQVRKMIDWLDNHGCTNHGCEVRHTKRAVGTNAGCSCIRDIMRDGSAAYLTIQRILRFKQAIATDRIKQLEAVRERVEQLEADYRNQRDAKEALVEHINKMKEAARLVIERNGNCASFVNPLTCVIYEADQWCDACIMREALEHK